jgi:hypothetical protein
LLTERADFTARPQSGETPGDGRIRAKITCQTSDNKRHPA